jgi:DNA-binding MarR family transcriptional regulator
MSDDDVFDKFVENLRRAFFALRAISSELGAEAECNPVDRGVLKELEEHGPLTVPTLALSRAVSRQAMQKTVDRLVDRGWLTIEPNPRHQRSVLLAISPAGRKVLLQVRRREKRLLARADLPVSDAELLRATRTLGELATFFGSATFQRLQARQGGSR